jgi:glycosyltransferase involved in cell wall biosynthesis
MTQPGKGKADAVFAGFDVATGDVLIILDADLTMPPEQLPKFWEEISTGRGEFVNGSRLVHPMEHEAMRFLNLIANDCSRLPFRGCSTSATPTRCAAPRCSGGPTITG